LISLNSFSTFFGTALSGNSFSSKYFSGSLMETQVGTLVLATRTWTLGSSAGVALRSASRRLVM
jgi:hypothetical protein